MKKLLIGAVVGGILMFLWQFLSWSIINIHLSQTAYHPNQDAILECLNTQISEDGFYFLPTAAPGASQEEMQAVMEESMGKPWAQVYYHKTLEMSMGLSMTRGLLVDIIAVALLAWLLLKLAEHDLKTCIVASLAVGILSYLTTHYTFSIWFQTQTLPDFIDALVSWGVVGAWLGWWLNRA